MLTLTNPNIQSTAVGKAKNLIQGINFPFPLFLWLSTSAPIKGSFIASQNFVISLLTMILVLALRSSVQEDVQIKTNKKKHVVMDDIFIYIREHLTEDISLERLENEFYVSRYHIVREFKKMTGETPHSYIVKSRLDLCRHYIEQGKSIREVYALGGFGGYNHFFRAFKKEYGVTPMQYYNNLQIDRNEK